MFAITPRLALRPGWPEDAATLAEAIGHETVVSRLSRVPWPYEEDDARAFLRDWSEPVPRFIVTERATRDIPIGVVGISIVGGQPNLGYWYTPAVWGRGYATEAGRAVVALARDGLRVPRLTATWHRGNPASGRVLSKLGFVETGRIVPQRSLALGYDIEAVEMELALSSSCACGPLPIAA